MPSIVGVSEFQIWLRGKPREAVAILTSRAVLRVLPILARSIRHHADASELRALLPVLRTARILSNRMAHSSSHPQLRLTSTAAYAAAEAAAAVSTASAVADVSYAIADAAYAIWKGDGVAEATDAVAAAANAAAEVAGPRDAGKHGIITETSDDNTVAGRDDIWSMIEDDSYWFEPRDELTDFKTVSAELAVRPLWAFKIPHWADDHWHVLRNHMLGTNQGWEVWIHWYEALLKGGPIYRELSAKANEEIEVAISHIPDEIWGSEAATINSEIARIVAEVSVREDSSEATAETTGDDHDAIVIPDQHPAAIEPEWVNDRLVLPVRPAESDLAGASITSALQALKSELGAFAESLDGEANIDPRVISFLLQLAEDVPIEVPPQDRLFALGHHGEKLTNYGTTVAVEWPPFLAAGYHALMLQFERVMRQFPEWRAFTAAKLGDIVEAEELSVADRLAQAIEDLLRDREAVGIVDPALPDAIKANRALLSPSDSATELVSGDSNQDSIAADVVESSNNTVKRIAEQALRGSAGAATYAAGELRDGVKEGTGQVFKNAGKAVVKWAVNALIGEGADLGKWLVLNYPKTFMWLRAVLDLINPFS